MRLNKLFYSDQGKVDFKKELVNGIYLFIVALVMIQWNADLLRSSFQTNLFNAVIPVLLFMLCSFSGLFTLILGLIFKKPLLVLPNLMLTVLISVYGTLAFGHSINHIMMSAFIALLISFLLFAFLSESQLQKLIPSSLVQYFPVILGLLLIIIGSIKAGFLIRFIEPAPSTLISTTALSEWHFPFRIGSILHPIQPIPLLVIAGFILFNITKKKTIWHSPLLIFLILTIVGFFIPVVWGRSELKGMITSLQPFSFISSSLKSSNFSMFFTNWQISSIRDFYSVISTTQSLVKLVFLFLVTFVFSNLYNLQTMHFLSTKSLDDTEESLSKHPLKMKPLSLLHHLFSFLGVSTNLAFFMTSAESSIAIDQSSRTGFPAVLSGLLLMAAACLIPLGFFSSQAGSAFLVIFLGFSMLNRGIQPILKQKPTVILPPIVFVLVTLLTFNPAEGLIMAILTDGFQRFIAAFLHQKGETWKDFCFLLTFILSLLYLWFYIIID